MSANDVEYFRLLKEEMDLFGQLAEIRAEQNSLHEAKMRAWDELRPKLNSNAQFEELWQQAKPPKNEKGLRQREQELIGQLNRTKIMLEHLRYAGLGDVA